MWQNVTNQMREKMKSTLMLACSRRSDPNGALASEYVQHAVNEWLQTMRTASQKKAMVVDHVAGSQTYLGDDPAADGWVQMVEPSDGVWQFQVMYAADPESNTAW